jgi:hypothetical protein
MTSSMRRVLRVLLALAVAAVLVAGLAVWRLSQGPVPLARAQPLLQHLVDRGSPFAVSFADPVLVWSREDDTLALEVKDLEIRDPDGPFMAGAPRAMIAVSVSALLLRWRIEPVLVTLDLPELELTRAEGGNLVLSFAGQLAALTLAEAAGGGGLDAILGGGSEAEAAAADLEELRAVRVTAPELRFFDGVTGRLATASAPVFELERHAGTWAASLGAGIGEGRIEIEGEPAATPGELRVRVILDRFPTRDLAGLLPDLPLEKLELPVGGEIRFAFDPVRRTFGEGEVALEAGRSTVAVPTVGLGPVPIQGARLEARLAPGWQAAEIGRLEVRGESYALSASGRLAREAGEVVGSGRVAAERLDVSDILALWPTALAADARVWVVQNVTAGRVTAATLEVGADGPRPGQPELAGSLAFTGVELRWLDTMPPAAGLAGTGSLAGHRAALKLSGGGTGGVALTGSEVTLTNLLTDAGPPRLRARLALRSSMADAARLLDNPPVALGKATGLSPAVFSGSQTADIDVNLPLVAQPRPADIRYQATVRLADLAVRDVRPGFSVAARSLTVRADPASVTASGGVTVNGVPVTVNWRENLGAVRGPTRRLELGGTADQAAARAFRVAWPERLSGSVGVKATVVEARSPLRTVDLALDLRQAGVRLPEILLTKREGQPASAMARLVQPDDRTLGVEEVRLDLGNLSGAGSGRVRLDPFRPERIVVRELRGLLGDLTADLALERGIWRGRVDVGQLDLRPVLRQGPGGAGGEGAGLPDMAVEVSSRQLRFGNAPFTGLGGTVERAGGAWSVARLRGRIEGSEVALDLQTRDRIGALTLRADDAGWLIRGFANSDNGVRGGRFRLSAELQAGGRRGSGELRIRDFTLWGAPTIARIVSLASFSGLGNALSGRGVPVQRFVVPFRRDGDRLRIEEARLVGADIGARADGTIDLAAGRLDISGTVAPAYTVNRIIGRIPIIGNILSGSRSDAALAATFTLTGPMAEPSVRVNPLAALVPGMVRDLFSSFTADTSSDLTPIDQR